MATIRRQLIEKRFEMLAKDLGWRDGEWKGKPYISKEQYGWRVWKLTTPTGSGETDIARFTTSREMLAWIEGAECAVKAMKEAYTRRAVLQDTTWPRNNDT